MPARKQHAYILEQAGPRSFSARLGYMAGALLLPLMLSACTAPTPAASTSSPAPDPGTTTVVTPVETPDPAFDYADHTPTLTLKTRGKECFGSAGCNQTVEVELAIDDPESIPADATGSISYTIKGGEDGPIQNTIDLTGGQYTQNQEVVSTPNRSTEVTVEVNEVVTD